MADMNYSRLRRVVEALHVVLLLAFAMYLPSCFEAMPSAETVDTVVKEYRLQCGAKGFEEDEAQSVNEADSIKIPETALKMSGQTSQIDDSKGQEASSDVDSSQNSWDACEVESGPRLTVMPFLVALIGGGVFSLEEFEAFPML